MRKSRPPQERFDEKVVVAENGCWLWTALCGRNGYGQFFPSKGVMRYAHRWAWEHVRGPIPGDREIDHLCRVRNCVNPDHLELVTRKENCLRGSLARITHCPQGHEYTQENTAWFSTGKSRGRRCRICWRTHQRKAYHRQRAERAAA